MRRCSDEAWKLPCFASSSLPRSPSGSAAPRLASRPSSYRRGFGSGSKTRSSTSSASARRSSSSSSRRWKNGTLLSRPFGAGATPTPSPRSTSSGKSTTAGSTTRIEGSAAKRPFPAGRPIGDACTSSWASRGIGPISGTWAESIPPRCGSMTAIGWRACRRSTCSSFSPEAPERYGSTTTSSTGRNA